MSEKLQPQHRARKAMLYVRQSTAFQVVNNHESGTLRDATQGRLRDLGFSDIEVIDEVPERSAAGAVTRSCFERMVAEVSLGRVGAVAARGVSRFAHNSREWQQLVEVCRIVDTVLIDQETVYNPAPATIAFCWAQGKPSQARSFTLRAPGSKAVNSTKPRRANCVFRCRSAFVTMISDVS
jgi:Resolvase, N terminal domain